MQFCEICGGEIIEIESKALGSDNVIKIFKCQHCGKETSKLEHIG